MHMGELYPERYRQAHSSLIPSRTNRLCTSLKAEKRPGPSSPATELHAPVTAVFDPGWLVQEMEPAWLKERLRCLSGYGRAVVLFTEKLGPTSSKHCFHWGILEAHSSQGCLVRLHVMGLLGLKSMHLVNLPKTQFRWNLCLMGFTQNK